jgi:hypothetical protein
MSAIPPQAVPPVTEQNVGGSAVIVPLLVTDSRAAQALSSLGQGSIIEAQVASNNGGGQVLISTDNAGLVAVLAKGGAADLLAAGAKVALQLIVGSDGQLSLRLLSVDGQPLARPLSPSGLAALSPSSVGPALMEALADKSPRVGVALTNLPSIAPQGAKIAAPPGLVATLVRPAVVSADVGLELEPTIGPDGLAGEKQPVMASIQGKDGGLPANLPIGTTVTVRILAVNRPGASPSDLPSPPLIPKPSTASPVSFDPGALVADDTPLPSAPPASVGAEAKASAPVLEGKVINAIAGQRIIVSTPIGLVSLPPVAALKTNAEVMFEVVSAPQLPQIADDGDGPPASPIDALNSSLASLQAEGEGAVVQRVMSVIPQMDMRLAANLSLMLKGMDRQSGQSLIDEDELEGLFKASPGEAAKRLLGALKDIQKSGARTVSEEGGWRGFTLPVATGALIEPVQFFIREPARDRHTIHGDEDPDHHGTGGAAKNREQRFLVELMLSRLGRLQMDGLVLRADKRFDLIVRTQAALSKEMRSDIIELFVTTTEAAGAKGSVSFQAGGRFVAVAQNRGHAKLNV